MFQTTDIESAGSAGSTAAATITKGHVRHRPKTDRQELRALRRKRHQNPLPKVGSREVWCATLDAQQGIYLVLLNDERVYRICANQGFVSHSWEIGPELFKHQLEWRRVKVRSRRFKGLLLQHLRRMQGLLDQNPHVTNWLPVILGYYEMMDKVMGFIRAMAEAYTPPPPTAPTIDWPSTDQDPDEPIVVTSIEQLVAIALGDEAKIPMVMQVGIPRPNPPPAPITKPAHREPDNSDLTVLYRRDSEHEGAAIVIGRDGSRRYFKKEGGRWRRAKNLGPLSRLSEGKLESKGFKVHQLGEVNENINAIAALYEP